MTKETLSYTDLIRSLALGKDKEDWYSDYGWEHKDDAHTVTFKEENDD